jgi:hypothetical protein
MGRIQRGFHLIGVSWGVLKEDRSLLVLPLLSAVGLLLLTGLMVGAAFGIGFPTGNEKPNPLLYVVAFVFYVLAAFIAIYFQSALIAVASDRLRGGHASVGDGLKMANQHLGSIFGWAVLTATVGMVIRAIEDRLGIFGRILGALAGVAWSAVTFFVVPVLVLEGVGPVAALKRSATLFKSKWGEQFTGVAAIGLAMFLISLPLLLVAGALGAVNVYVGVTVGLLLFGLLALVGSALSGIFNAALYRYAVTGESSGGFSDEDLHGAFAPRRGGRASGFTG